LAGGKLSLQAAGPVQQTIPVTGFDQDVIWANSELSPVAGTTTTYDTGTKILYQAGSLFAPANSGLPNTGQILSATTPGVSFQLQPYNANNDLLFTDTTTSKTLTLATPLSFTSLNVLSTSAGGSTYNMTLNFTDGSSHAIGTGVAVSDRANSTGSASGFVG